MPSDDRRNALIAAGLSVMARDGIAATTTRAIVTEANMPLGAFHYCFANKDEFLREISGALVAKEFAAGAAALRPGDDIQTSISTGLTYWFDYIESGPDQQQVLFELGQFARRSPALEGLDRDQYTLYWTAAEQIIVAFGEAADVSWTIEPSELARLLVAALEGVTLGWLADRNGKSARAALDILARLLVSLTIPNEPLIEQTLRRKRANDLGEGVPTEPIKFSLDDTEYLVDLNAESANEFAKLLRPYIRASRRIPSRQVNRHGAPSPTFDNAAVRIWAAEQGINLSSRGRIPDSVLKKYAAAS